MDNFNDLKVYKPIHKPKEKISYPNKINLNFSILHPKSIIEVKLVSDNRIVCLRLDGSITYFR